MNSFVNKFTSTCTYHVLPALQRSCRRRANNHGRAEPGSFLETGALRAVLSENPDSERERPSKGGLDNVSGHFTKPPLKGTWY